MIIALKDTSAPISLIDVYKVKQNKKNGFTQGIQQLWKGTSFYDFWTILKADPESPKL